MSFIDISFSSVMWSIVLSLLFFEFSRDVSQYKSVNRNYINAVKILFVIINSVSALYLINSTRWLSPVVFLFVSFLYISIFYKNNIFENMVMCLGYYISVNFIFNIFQPVIHRFINNSNYIYILIELVYVVFMSVISFILIDKFLCRFLCYKEHHLTNKEFCWLMFFGIIGFISLLFYKVDGFIFVTALSIVSLLLFSSNIKIIRNEKTQKNIAEKNNLLKQQDVLIKEKDFEKYMNYKKSEEIEAKIKELSETLETLLCDLLAEKNLPSKLRKNVEDVKQLIDFEYGYFNTGCAILDLVLQEKCIEAESAGIKFKVIGDFSDGLILEPDSVSLIFGNLLTNSIQACKNINSEEYKCINTNFYQEPEKKVYICIENTNFDKPIKKTHGEVSTIRDYKNQLHGTGLKNVRKEVHKYGGDMNISWTDVMFKVEIIIPLQR